MFFQTLVALPLSDFTPRPLLSYPSRSRKAKGFAALLTVMLTLLCHFPAAIAENATPQTSLKQGLVSGNSEFAVQLYHRLGDDSVRNLFFSPYSVSSALGMTYVGALGNTADEMKAALHFKYDQNQLADAFKSYNRELISLSRADGQKLRIANGLCLTGGNVSEAYKAILHESFDAEMFSGGLDQVNSWVAQKTEGKIPTILDQLDANSVCVILNAIYFKGTWESQFQKNVTRAAAFMVSPSKQVTTQLMYQKDNFKMLEDEELQAISIPYKGNALSMVVLLPKDLDGLASLEKKLTAQSLAGWMERLDQQESRSVKLYFPKFTMETDYDLVAPLSRMGMLEAFGSGADFSGMGWAKGALYISQIKHKAFVDVNEEGTEAAAATAVEMATKSMPFEPEFRADHPFLFLIRDNRNGTLLFIGRVCEPTTK